MGLYMKVTRYGNIREGVTPYGSTREGVTPCATIIIIIMVIFKCYFSRKHIALSYKKWCGHRIRKNQQIKSTAMMENHT